MRTRSEPPEFQPGHPAHEVFWELTHLYQTEEIGLCMLDRELRYVRINNLLARTHRVSVEDHLGRTLREVSRYVADALEPLLRKVIETGEPLPHFELQSSWPGPEERRWWLSNYRPLRSQSGEVVGVSGVVREITDLKRAEDALRASEAALRASEADLRELAGRLLQAQEEERSRLARELHDDLSQRLAVLAIEAGKLEHELDSDATMGRARARGLRDQIASISQDVHAISRQLHPSILEDLGLTSAIESECSRYAHHEGISIQYEHHDIPPELPKEVALSLYRIAQESLRNIAKHAQTNVARISLVRVDGEVLLSIEDDGMGFEPTEAESKAGVGLASMAERARLMHGDLTIRAASGRGTHVSVRVPLPEASA